ncbi:MAG TPA: hypothetical protein ENK54_04280 [Thiotrichales bacterium]|nr:hypothetical protein [Thiotrichales bacterium]
MPYFVYRREGNRRPEFLESHARYRDAKNVVREMRKSLPEGGDTVIRLVFAKHEEEALRLVTTPREARPAGEDA